MITQLPGDRPVRYRHPRLIASAQRSMIVDRTVTAGRRLIDQREVVLRNQPTGPASLRTEPAARDRRHEITNALGVARVTDEQRVQRRPTTPADNVHEKGAA